MRNKLIYSILSFIIVSLIGCGTDNKNQEKTALDLTTSISKSDSIQPDTFELRETFNQEDLPVNEYLKKRLKPIRTNFKRINSITDWTIIKTKDIWKTSEGGDAKFYYLNGQLEKITTRHFGETFQLLTEYYLLKEQLSFVFEKTYKYNRPVYYDSIAMKEMNDTETFDLKKSKTIEYRTYFEDGKLLYQLNNQDSSLHLTDKYLIEEQKRIKTNFKILIKM